MSFIAAGEVRAFFKTLLDARDTEHLRAQYWRFRAALAPA